MSDVEIVEEGKGKLGMRLMKEYLKGYLRREEKGMGEGRKESAVSLRLCYGQGMSVSPNHNDHIPQIPP